MCYGCNKVTWMRGQEAWWRGKGTNMFGVLLLVLAVHGELLSLNQIGKVN